MDGHDRVYVVEEVSQALGFGGIDGDRRKMDFHTWRLMKSVVTRTGQLCRSLSYHIGHQLESATVIRHETDALRPIELVAEQCDDLFDVGVMKNVTKHVCQFPRRESSRRRAITVYVTAARTTMLNATASGVRFESIHC